MPVKKLAEITNLDILLSVLVSFLNLSTDLVLHLHYVSQNQ